MLRQTLYINPAIFGISKVLLVLDSRATKSLGRVGDIIFIFRFDCCTSDYFLTDRDDIG